MRKGALALAVFGTIFFSSSSLLATTSHADEQATPQSSTTSVGPIHTPEPRDAEGREIAEPREHRDHDRGLGGESIAIVIGALIIAVGLAYGIGRRQRH